MKNRFLLPEQSSYDVVIVIPTLPKSANQHRMDIITECIQKYPPKDLTFNIYLAYEGSDWNQAVNIAFERVKSLVHFGFILMDDDSFPLPNWADKLSYYIQKYPSSLLQFCLLDKKGFYNTYYFCQVDNFSRTLRKFTRKAAHKENRDLYGYTRLTRSTYYTKLKEPVKVAFAVFSGVFIPLRAYETVGQVASSRGIIYHEDLDFSFQAMEKGFSSLMIPQYILHFWGSTKMKKPTEYTDKINSSDKWLYQKWFTQKWFVMELEKQGFTKKMVFSYFWAASVGFMKRLLRNHRFASNFMEILQKVV